MCVNKLFGFWVVDLFGKFGDEVEVYVKIVVVVDFEEVGNEDVICKVVGDFGDKFSVDEVCVKFVEILKVVKD